MPFLLIAAGVALFVLTRKKTAEGPPAGVCPVTPDQINALWAAPPGPDGNPTDATVAALRAMALRLDGCGQGVQASTLRAGLFLITNDPADAGPPSPGDWRGIGA